MRAILGRLCNNVEWSWSSGNTRDERKAQKVVTVVKRPVAARLEANVAGDQTNEAGREVCTVATSMGALCCVRTETSPVANFFDDAPLNPADAGTGLRRTTVAGLPSQLEHTRNHDANRIISQ